MIWKYSVDIEEEREESQNAETVSLSKSMNKWRVQYSGKTSAQGKRWSESEQSAIEVIKEIELIDDNQKVFWYVAMLADRYPDIQP